MRRLTCGISVLPCLDCCSASGGPPLMGTLFSDPELCWYFYFDIQHHLAIQLNLWEGLVWRTCQVPLSRMPPLFRSPPSHSFSFAHESLLLLFSLPFAFKAINSHSFCKFPHWQLFCLFTRAIFNLSSTLSWSGTASLWARIEETVSEFPPCRDCFVKSPHGVSPLPMTATCNLETYILGQKKDWHSYWESFWEKMSDGDRPLPSEWVIFFPCVNIEADMQESDKAVYRNWSLCLGGVFLNVEALFQISIIEEETGL